MARQTILPFKLERTNDHITARSGLALYAGFLHALGGETLEDVREIREDQTLRQALDLPPLPSSSAIGDWLKRMRRRGGLQGMAQGTTAIAQRGLMHEDRTAYTLLVDPTIIAAEQHEAQMTDLGGTGSRPGVATLQALGLIIAYDCKAGTDTGGRVEILRQAFQHLPSSKRIETVLVDVE